MNSRSLKLEHFNSAAPSAATQLLQGIYEHTAWIAQRTIRDAQGRRMHFATLAALKQALVATVTNASPAEQVALIRAHPELAGKAMVANALTAESTDEQSKAGLTHCTPEQFSQLQQLNQDYNKKFGWPFILAVRGPRGLGLKREHIIATFTRRLRHPPDLELAECLRQIHRIAEIRLNDRFGEFPADGDAIWDWQEALAQHSDTEFAQRGQLTVTYKTAAHQACAAQIAQHMRDSGFDSVEIDLLGNVIGRYEAANHSSNTRWLMTGSHYDTVRNGGKYDGRLGIFIPIKAVEQLHQHKQRLPYGLEVVAFAEEEGQRFKATFLAASALTGSFDAAWLAQQDADGVPLAQLLESEPDQLLEKIATLKRDPKHYLGFIEIHIEQGPVLNQLNLPLAAVTSINGSARYLCQIQGVASHAGTTPMNRRRDAVNALAQLALYIEQRASQVPELVATIGQLNVPNGSINVVPGQCHFSLDMRAPNDALRDGLVTDVLTNLDSICAARGVQYRLEKTMQVNAAPSAPHLQQLWESSIAHLGLPVFRLPSGAGHDAMKLHDIMPQAMLFVRGENGGISHNPLESTTSDDMQLALDAFHYFLHHLKPL